MLALIPKLPRSDTPYKIAWASPGKRSPSGYLAWPAYMILNTWFCFAGPRKLVEQLDGRTYVIDYCGAPPGVRCDCGSQLHGHDPGDE